MLKKRVTPPEVIKVSVVLSLLIVVIGTGSLSSLQSETNAETTVEDTLEKAERLIAESKFYEAISALKPLLNANEKSEVHEKSLYLADVMCRRLAKVLTTHYLETWDYELEDDLEKSLHALEVLGVHISTPSEIIGTYKYDHFFLKQLVKKYPESSAVPAAVYYLIKGKYYRANEDVVYGGMPYEVLVELYEYVDKHGQQDIAEVYMVYLDIAHIYHGLWSMYAFPEAFDMPPVAPSGDSETDKAMAVKYREIALRYYLKFLSRKDQTLQSPYKFQDVLEDYEKLKYNQKSGLWFIFVGC